MKKRVSFLLAAFILVISAGVFTGCDSNVDGGNEGPNSIPMPETLKGTWDGEFSGEIYRISDTTFVSEYTYSGTVVNVREDGSGAGYITIKLWDHWAGDDAIGNYYVIHYRNLTSTTVYLSGAYSVADPDNGGGAGKESQALAESTYTTGNGYFDGGSACTKKIGEIKWPNKLEGTWICWDDTDIYEEDDEFIITDDTIIWSYGGFYPMFTGEIVNFRDNDTDGYITFKYVGGSQADKFGVVYWRNHIPGTSVELAHATESGALEGEDTQQEAEEEYIAANWDYFDHIGTFEWD